MPKSIWNGTITFGQVNVPIKLYSATESKTVHFHELHEKDQARIEHRRFCSKEDKEVPYEEVVKGYEVGNGKYVVLEKEEVAAADPSGGKVVELEHFVRAEEIDGVFYDRTYYVGAQKGGEDGYRLLLEALKSSERDLGVHFTQLHEKEGAPIDTRRFCSKEDKEVPYEQIVAGYELKKGKWVTLTDEDFEAVEPRKTRTIDIEAFVPVEDVDPIYFDHPYFLVPVGGEGAARAYRLLVRVMKDSDRLALGRFVLRTKEYLAAIHVRDDALALTTMLFHDEVRPTKGID